MSQVMRGSVSNVPTRLNKYGYNCIARHIGLVVVLCAPLFIGAGTLNWAWAWLYTIVTFLGWVALSLVLVKANPELLNERGKRIKDLTGTKRWDWWIMGAYAVLLIATPLVAGLDQRYAWTAPLPDAIKLIGVALLALSFAPLTWSMAVNRFFEGTVRIQSQRGQRVISAGPYAVVRHPGYVGVMLSFIAVPMALGASAAWIPALLALALYVIRTYLEDRTLQAELPGYAQYAQNTRYRLIPGLW